MALLVSNWWRTTLQPLLQQSVGLSLSGHCYRLAHNSLAVGWSWAKIGAAEESEETSSDIIDSLSEFSECEVLKAFEFTKWHNGVSDAGPVFYILPKNVLVNFSSIL